MRSRLVDVCHLFGGITPMNVWTMSVDDWLMFSDAVDSYRSEHAKAER